jgi:predicted nuclease of predicted toxin-antitoxin system
MNAPVRLDAHLSPALAPWIEAEFNITARSASRLGLREATDREIFDAARDANAVIVTKDGDFLRLLERLGPPPGVILLTFGNTTTAHLKSILRSTLRPALRLVAHGEPLVEISG